MGCSTPAAPGKLPDPMLTTLPPLSGTARIRAPTWSPKNPPFGRRSEPSLVAGARET
jgi:hypothetical protein